MVKKEEYTGKSDSDHYLKYAMCYGIQCIGRIHSTWRRIDNHVSNNLLPLGSLGYVLFCTKKNGWGWNSFLEEINQGEGWKFPAGIKGYMSYGLPLLIIIIYLKGYYDKFQPMGTKTLIGWMIVAFLFLAFVIGCSCGKSTAEKVDK